MKGPLFIRWHLGLGDAYICNGMVHVLREGGDLVLPCKPHNMATVTAMFKGDEGISIRRVVDDAEMKALARGFKRVLNLGLHSGEPLDKVGWDRQLYRQAGVEFRHRWDSFRIPPSTWECPKRPYAFVHEDPKRGYSIDLKRLTAGLEVIRPEGMSNALDYVPLIRCATEIHCIDSSFLCLADSLETRAVRHVFHRYARPEGLPPTLSRKWEIL